MMVLRARRVALAITVASALLISAGMNSPDARAASLAASCSPGAADCSGWHRTNVLLTWTYSPAPADLSGCASPQQYFSSDTPASGRSVTCVVKWASTTLTGQVTLFIDKTSPILRSFGANRRPDSNGWYNHPLGINFIGTDSSSGIARCTRTVYGGPDRASVSILGGCTDVAGNSASRVVTFAYDATPPAVTPVPDRPPDHNGWYNHPFGVRFSGSDRTSGLAACTSATYGGPDSGSAALGGWCRDRAGNVTARTFAFRYDATPPRLRLRGTPGDRVARLSWRADCQGKPVKLLRRPGLRGGATSVLYVGRRSGYRDARVRNGARYRYTLGCHDPAGNGALQTTRVRPGIRLLSPSSGARVRRPPVLRWTSVRHARYYNAQLLRNGHKVLSLWPLSTHLALKARWRYAGRRYRLAPGHYRWYVWPGFGPRSAGRYGRLIGQGTFVVVR
jgi:hypothetical protein